MDLKAGTRLRSVADATEVVIVRAPSEPVDLRCGGHPMVALDADVPDGGSVEAGFDEGSQLGKRYADENTADYEEDHIIPLELGGAPRDEANLRPEAWTAAHTKDATENRLHTEVCSGALTLYSRLRP